MRISIVRPSRPLKNLAAVAVFATALPAASIVWAQARKEQADRPQDVKKAGDVPAQKVVAEVPKDAAPMILMQKAAIAPFGVVGQPLPAGAAAPEPPEAMVRQMIQQLLPVFRVEFGVLTSAAGPTPEQRRAIAIDGGRVWRDVAIKVATVQHALNTGGFRGGAFPDARKSIREGLLASAREKLSAEQVARYQEEIDLKSKDQRRVIVLNIVANLDRLLFLSRDQREKITESLLSHWDDRSFPTLENLANYEAYFPALPDRHLTPILNDAQKNTWNAAQKVTFGQSFNFNFNNGMAGWPADQDEDLKAAFAEAEKKK